MAYVRKIWADDEIIEAVELNHIEDGISTMHDIVDELQTALNKRVLDRLHEYNNIAIAANTSDASIIDIDTTTSNIVSVQVSYIGAASNIDVAAFCSNGGSEYGVNPIGVMSLDSIHNNNIIFLASNYDKFKLVLTNTDPSNGAIVNVSIRVLTSAGAMPVSLYDNDSDGIVNSADVSAKLDDGVDGKSYLDIVTKIITEIGTHASNEDAHHVKYTNAEAVAAVNADTNHGTTASHNYRTDEEIRDIVAAFIVHGENVLVTHDDVANTLTIASNGLSSADRVKFDGIEPLATADQTGSEIVALINAGTSKIDADNIAGLPDGKIQNVVVGKSGSPDYLTSDYTSDDLCLQAAINYAKSANIHTLIVQGPETYTMGNYVTVDFDLSIQGVGNPVFQWSTSSIDLIQCNGSIAKTVLGTADVSLGAKTVTVADASGVMPGHLVFIRDNVIWNTTEELYDTWKTGEIHEVVSVSGNIISFFEGTLHAYTMANNLSVDIIHPISVDISNIAINGIDETAQHRFFGLNYCKNSSVHHCILNKASEHGIYFYNSYNVSAYKNRITNCENSGNGYGVCVGNASAHVSIHDNNISQCRHCTATGGSYTVGQSRDIRVYNNELYNTIGHAIDAHQCVESLFAYNNTIHGNGTEKFAITSGAKITKFTGNILYDCLGATIRGNLPDMIYIVENNIAFRSGHLFTDNSQGTNSEKYVSITNNQMFDSVYYIASIAKAKDVLISNNSIDGTTNYYAIYVTNATSGIISNNRMTNVYRSGISLVNSSNLIVSENNILDCCQFNANGELHEAGIALRGCTYTHVLNNTVKDTTGKMRYGIREYGEADNNVIKNNNMYGATIAQISKLGANTKVSDNIGYHLPGQSGNSNVVVGKSGSVDFLTSEYTSDSACLQAAINYAITSGISEVAIRAGTYTLSAVLTISSNLNIIGIGDVTFILQIADNSGGGLYFNGSLISEFALPSDVLKGAYTIPLVNASTFKSGDIVKIWNNTPWCSIDYPTLCTGESYLIDTINGNTLVLDEPLIRDYLVSGSTRIEISRPIKIKLSNVKIIDQDATGDRQGAVFIFCKDVVVENCLFSNSGTAGLSFYTCYNVNVHDNKVYNCIKEGSGYGIGVWNASAHVDIHHNYVKNCRHAITGNCSEWKAENRKVDIYKNTLIGASIVGSDVIDSHPVTIDYSVHDNLIYPQPGYFAFYDGCLESEFYHNIVIGGNGAVLRRGSVNNGVHIIRDNYTKLQQTEITGYSATYFAANTGNGDRITISGNTQIGGNYGVAFKYNEIFDNITIENNKFSNIFFQGILVNYAKNLTNVKIQNNKISQCGLGGINVDGKTFTNGRVYIDNNILDKTWTSTGSKVAIAINNITHSEINDNKITDVDSNYSYGIYEGVACDYNNILRNNISGAVISGVYKTGVNTTVIDNIGYRLPKQSGTNTIVVGKSDSVDFLASEYSSDSICIQAAIDSIPSSGGCIYITDGMYDITTSLDFKGNSNITIYSNNSTLIRNAALISPIFRNTIVSYGTEMYIQAAYGIGVKTIALSDTSEFLVGDLVKIVELNSTNYERVDTVTAVDSTTVTLQHGLKWGTTIGSSSISKKSGVSKNITLDGLTLTDAAYVSSTKDPLISISNMYQTTLKNIKLYNCSGYSAIRALYSKSISMSNIQIDGVVHATLGYGISLESGTSDVIISDSIINETRHATTGDRAYDIIISNVIANGITTLANTSHSFDTHSYMKDISYVNCQSNGAYGGLNVRGQRINITNMIINSPMRLGITIQTTANDIQINTLQLHNTGTWGGFTTAVLPIEIYSNNVTINNLRIIQDLPPSNPTMVAIGIHNSQNIHLNDILIDDRSQTGLVHGIEVSSTNSDIKLSNCDINTYRTGYAITVSSGTSDSNINNITALKSVSILGTNNKIKNISSYITENTGAVTIPAGQTSIIIPHGLAVTPNKILFNPSSNPLGKYSWSSDPGTTSFKINIGPDAAVSDISFNWSAVY